MNGLIITLWISNVLCDTVGQIAFKYAALHHQEQEGLAYWLQLVRCGWLWVGVGSYLVEFLLWLAFLTLVPLSQAILLGSVNIIAVMIVGRLFFAEVFIPLRLAGILLITAGVAIVGVS